jgi:hypothetical protein
MGRPGRKRKEGEREPNGQLRRPTMQQLNELNRARLQEEKVVVLNQPHRRGGAEDNMQESPLGRFILLHFPRDPKAKRRGIGEIYFDAAMEYAKVVRSWRASADVKTDINPPSDGLGTGQEPSRETVAGWWLKIKRVESALIFRGRGDLLRDMKQLILHEYEIPGADPYQIKLGLWIIATEMGKLDGKQHPFQ